MLTAAGKPAVQARDYRNPPMQAMLHATMQLPKQPLAFLIFSQRFSHEWSIRSCSMSTEVQLQCTDHDNRSYRNVCNMSFVAFSLAVIFIIRLFSTSAFSVPNIYFVLNWMISNFMFFGIFIIMCSLCKIGLLNAKIQFSSLAKSPKSCKNFKSALQ